MLKALLKTTAETALCPPDDLPHFRHKNTQLRLCTREHSVWWLHFSTPKVLSPGLWSCLSVHVCEPSEKLCILGPSLSSPVPKTWIWYLQFLLPWVWEGRRGAGGGVAEVAQLFPLAEFECSLIVELCPLRARVVKSLDSKMVEPLGCGA